MVLIFIVINLVTFFFVSVHLDGWAQGLARLFIPEVRKFEFEILFPLIGQNVSPIKILQLKTKKGSIMILF